MGIGPTFDPTVNLDSTRKVSCLGSRLPFGTLIGSNLDCCQLGILQSRLFNLSGRRYEADCAWEAQVELRGHCRRS